MGFRNNFASIGALDFGSVDFSIGDVFSSPTVSGVSKSSASAVSGVSGDDDGSAVSVPESSGELFKITSNVDDGKGEPVVKSSSTSLSTQNNLSGNELFNTFFEKLKATGLKYRVTSHFRKGSTKQGKFSHHNVGNAADLVFDDYNHARDTIKKNPELVSWMKDNGLNVLDETTPEMLARTGGTGNHWHIGRDSVNNHVKSADVFFAMRGGVINKFSDGGSLSDDFYIPKLSLASIDTIDFISDNTSAPDLASSFRSNIEESKRVAGMMRPESQASSVSTSSSASPTSSSELFKITSNIDDGVNSGESSSSSASYDGGDSGEFNSSRLVNSIVSGEGFRSKAYSDSHKGVRTIGHGLTDPKILEKYKDGITEADSLSLVRKHIDEKVLPYIKKDKTWSSIWSKSSPSQREALVEIGYIVGANGLTNNSPKLKDALMRGDYATAANEIDYKGIGRYRIDHLRNKIQKV